MRVWGESPPQCSVPVRIDNHRGSFTLFALNEHHSLPQFFRAKLGQYMINGSRGRTAAVEIIGSAFR